jgi:calcineurin-like phosphoesterase family protein
MIFFTSDEHYTHKNIIRNCHRPFADVAEMREGLIERHNSKVGKNDRTFHLGDMFWRHTKVDEAHRILDRLNGAHVLLWGNHDEVARKVKERFQFVDHVYQLNEPGFPSIWLSHYAHRAWPESHQGAYHLYGHTHDILPDYRRSFDAGVDANDYYPVSLVEVDEYIRSKGKIAPDEIELDIQKKGWDKAGQ